MNSYQDMEIFHESKRLAIEVHRVTLQLPAFELYEEGSQLRRSSKSVTVNIVEGFGRRRYRGDFIKYLVVSMTECDETIVHLNFIYQTKSFKDESKFLQLTSAYTILAKRINKFIQTLEP